MFPHLASAKPEDPGGALFVPAQQHGGRIDTPRRQVLYLSSTPVGAVAEVFASLAAWTPQMFESPAGPGARRALGRYELADSARILDLDDAETLRALGLRPSEVVSPDRQVTQRWARSVVAQRRWDGARWWSFHDSRWYSYGLWDRRDLRLIGVDPLSLDHPAVVEAATVLRRSRG